MVQTEADVQVKVRGALKAGKKIAVVGWRDSNHDTFTRSLSTDQVVFVGSTLPPDGVGFILLTDTVTPQLRGRATNRRPAAAILLGTPSIKTLFEGCRDLLNITPQPAATPLGGAAEDGGQSAEAVEHTELLDFITKPLKELTPMEKFTEAFLAEAEKNAGKVGKRTLGKLIRAHGVQSAPNLAKSGWIIAHKGEGRKKIGSYQPGEKMKKAGEKIESLPNDPVERARYMIGQKDLLLAQKAALEAQLADIDGKLKVIEQAEGLFGKLTDLLK